ncbi:MAG: tetratricopeptide repeat protein [Phycisphaeraceae bacterium]
MSYRHGRPSRTASLFVCAAVVFSVLTAAPAFAQDAAAQAAMLLDSAKRAFNEKQYAFAGERFKQFIQQFGNLPQVTDARYGLALSILEGPAAANLPNGIDRDYTGAIDALNPVAGAQGFADRPFAIYYMGIAYRGQGQHELKLAQERPNEAVQRRAAAVQPFTQATARFAEAQAAFAQRAAAQPVPAEGELPADVEWSARCRCDQAEMLLQLGKYKEAGAAVEPFMKDATLARSKARDLGRYYFGYANYAQKDYLAAGRALSMLAPFKDAEFGVHARYLLARTHHLAEERPEAAPLYESLLSDYEQQVLAAKQAAGNPGQFKDNPRELERLQQVAKGIAPQHVERASYYFGVLLFEQGQFAPALDRFTKFSQQFAKSTLLPDAQLRAGYCQVKQKQFAEATKLLQPLQDHAQLGYRARWWLARAQIGGVDANNAEAVKQAMAAASQQFRTAADRANQLAGSDPDAKLARVDILLELADTLQATGQPRDAATVYQQVVNEKIDPNLTEQAAQRLAAALHLSRAFKESDDACMRFIQTYPKSTLLSPVLFRYAENAFAQAEATMANLQDAGRAAKAVPLYDEAIKRYQQLIEKDPDFAQTNLARFGQAMSHYRMQRYDQATAIIKTIPEADRAGDVAEASYILADCLMRTAPTETGDALSAGKALGQLTEAMKMLEAYAPANEGKPQGMTATLKLGDCYQRVAELMGDANEKLKYATSARTLYETFRAKYPNDPLAAVAEFERHKSIALQGDIPGAMQRLERFRNQDPYQNSAVAPLAMVRLAAMLRSQDRAAEAVTILAECRQRHEGNMSNDPARRGWVPMVQYHHAMAVKETGKLDEAKAMFEQIARQFAQAAEAPDAAWRAGQCRQETARRALEQARVVLYKADAKPEEIHVATAAMAKAASDLRETGQYFESQAAPIAQKAAGSEPHLRMLYEAAWCQRLIGDIEVDNVRRKLREDARKVLQDKAAKETPQGQPVPQVSAPEVAVSGVPWQPAQQRAVQLYGAIVEAKDDSLLSMRSRFEQAEMHSVRGAFDAAIPLLAETIDLEPPTELAEKVHLRLGACLLEKNDPKAAADQFAVVAQSPRPALAAEARYRSAEALMAQKDFNNAIQLLTPFRDQEPWRNMPGIADRALLRLGHAYGFAGNWDASHTAMELVINRFGNSDWRQEARYGMGWAHQNRKNWDAAIGNYREVVKATGAEVAAKSQFQIGLCFIEKKDYAGATSSLLVVPFTYDYPQWSAAALCEAARAFVEQKQPDQAKNLLTRVIKDFDGSEWAKVAQQRLTELK